MTGAKVEREVRAMELSPHLHQLNTAYGSAAIEECTLHNENMSRSAEVTEVAKNRCNCDNIVRRLSYQTFLETFIFEATMRTAEEFVRQQKDVVLRDTQLFRLTLIVVRIRIRCCTTLSLEQE